jgi:hypothetical protein
VWKPLLCEFLLFSNESSTTKIVLFSGKRKVVETFTKIGARNDSKMINRNRQNDKKNYESKQKS